jgi:hypothetical protein
MGCRKQPENGLAHHRFAGTGLADDAENFLLADVQRNSANRKSAI